MGIKSYILRGMLVLLVIVLSMLLTCAKPAPAPAPAPAPKPTPAPAPTTAPKPAPSPTAAPAPVAWPKAIRVTVTPMGTSLAVYGSAVAGIIEKNTKVIVTPQPTTGGLESGELFAKGESEMGTTNGFVTQSIYIGRQGHTKATDRVRGFSGGYKSAVHIVVRADSKINSIADLKGKRCMFVRPGEVIHSDVYAALFKAYGMTEKDVVLMPALGPRDQVQALKEGTTDATLQYSAPPNPEYAEMDRAIPIRQLPIEADKQAQILKDVPYEYMGVIKGGTYKGTPNDTPALYIDSWVSMARQMPDDFAYAAAKAIVENIADLQAAHAMFKTWRPEDLVANPVVPFHAGAFKYYKEKGLITPEIEKKHNDLLKQMDQKS